MKGRTSIRSRPARFKPALSHDLLTPLYDPLLRAVLRESRIRTELVDRIDPIPGQRILDLGCGTATLTLMLKESCQGAGVFGLDGDAAVLRIASGKTARTGLIVPLVRAFADHLPCSDCCFDRVVSSLMFHHLDRQTKRDSLREIHRVLRPGGEFHLADFGRPGSRLSRLGFLLIQLLDGFDTTGDNLRGEIPALVEEAGLAPNRPPICFNTIVGKIELRSFEKPLDATCSTGPAMEGRPSTSPGALDE